VGSNLAESDGFLRVIKIHNITSFGGDVKPFISCHKILWHVKDPLRYDRVTDTQNSAASIPTNGLLIIRLVMSHKDTVILSSLTHTNT
jgi:hypothetical protein